MAFVEKTGKTVDEAVAEALKALNITADQAEIEVLEEGKKAFGQWSSKITFLCITKQDDDNKKEDGGGNDDTGDISPVYKKEIKLINYPKNGETPESFILEFSDNIDPNFKGEIYIIRRDT